MLESGWIKTRRRQVKIEKVVGWYDVWTGDLPFAKFTLRVVENESGGFQATPNVFVKSGDGIEYTCGIGSTVSEAVADGIDRFYDEIEKVTTIDQITEDCFAWLCWTPFGATPFEPESDA
jgi:hypothetical protein